MRLATIKHEGKEQAAVVMKNGIFPIQDLNDAYLKQWPTDVMTLLESGQLEKLDQWLEDLGESGKAKINVSPLKDVNYAMLYRHPRKIWGIGLNYVEHASDLSETAPNTEPASFMKPDTTIIGPKDTIQIPLQSKRTTAEAELGIIIGKTCKDVPLKNAPDVIAGYTTVIDMTAEDILQKNPRYLTRSKSFNTFFSFGPHLVTPDEVGDVHNLEVSTMINGNLHRKNVVSNMTFKPWDLVSFHSQVMTLLPGDIISTGTPGAAVIRDGDIVSCQVDGFEPLENPVEDLKLGQRV
ncbi:2-keto-4-pentenoate hydratase/2-oxohepta-3-ene-1,7-dioic acid hydratase (catechol pathway) [Lentibacillus halodurans]|uniref:2-keto-4-pentenoate hydratase/2-oxohepta-3-ene-1,7-dioic acid hydratase (Catechol pathway) n=1 Tax=Lentibacillus halodurans TaxID=237679 RepID=A0A1I0XJK7_9BACI|nr:fumarylacetoacetate hydrolase family protein [Lentibacillus halodurans]SFB00408.1 2-keto-4-pentenoate hydratase/2-oxohepta-3-ene-1,7-dioic acid hydratase (catechol pathway) [Lentibacillus halodurans]